MNRLHLTDFQINEVNKNNPGLINKLLADYPDKHLYITVTDKRHRTDYGIVLCQYAYSEILWLPQGELYTEKYLVVCDQVEEV